MKLGTMEFLIILLVAFLVLGPERTLIYARKLGRFLRTAKVYISSLTDDLRETVVEPLQEIQKPLSDITAPITELTQAVSDPVKEINSALLGTDKPRAKASTADETKAGEETLEFAELESDDVPEPVQAPENHAAADIDDAVDAQPPNADDPGNVHARDPDADGGT